MNETETRYHSFLVLVIVLAVGVFLFSVCIGRYPVSIEEILKALLMRLDVEPTVKIVVFQIRFPRIISAMLVGSALAISGAAFQGLFKNPLVSSYHLGVSSGAGFGAALAIILSGSIAMVQGSAFLFGAIAVALTYGLSRVYKGSSTLALILSGIIISSFFSALVSLLQYTANPRDQLPAIVFWLMGSLSAVSNESLLGIVFPMVVGTIGLMLVRWRINVLSMGEDEAQALGIDLRRLVALIVGCATIVTTSAVCISGVIGWIGLVIPHIGRMLVGPDYKKLLPVCSLIGAIYLLLMDDIARTLTDGEIPLGILTSLIGAPFFAFLLIRNRMD
ncbi:MAG: iron complex transport system permease protein [Thermoproteota archaeon]|nr:iron complex transport system permease protein [Thermoproteota archaeon]